MVKEYDKILFRLTDILTKLAQQQMPTLSDLTKEYNVSIRTIQRDIYVRLNKFPIIVNASKQLQFMDGFSLSRTKLSIEEMMTMTLSLELIKNKGKEFQKASQNLMDKILYEKVFMPYYIKPAPSEYIDMDSSLLNTLEEAITYANLIKVTYKTNKEQIIAPIKIINFDGFWYLLGKADGEVSIDMISTIQTVSLLEEKHTLNACEKKLYENAHTPFFNTRTHFCVTLKVLPHVAHYFKLKMYLPSQKICEETKDGSLIVSFDVTHFEEIDNLVKSWLPDIQILTPLSYRDAFKEELSKYIKCIND